MDVVAPTSSNDVAAAGLWTPPPQTPGAVRVVCFPCLGADIALFRGWADLLAPEARLSAVRLPGRGGRRRERPFEDFDAAAAGLAAVVDAIADEPYVLFGYSMGALLAFDVAQRLRRLGAPAPRALVVVARVAPQERVAAMVPQDAPDEDLVTMLRRLGGTPEKILSSPEMLRIVLPTVRADLRLLHSYRHRHEAPLACPIVAISGRDDVVCPPDLHEGWRSHTSASFRHIVLEAQHDVVPAREREVVATVVAHLTGGGEIR